MVLALPSRSAFGADQERTVDEALAYIEELIDRGIGDSPVYDPVYMGSTCPSCGRPRATREAWITLDSGDGTNLCWENCEPDFVVPAQYIIILAEEVRRLRRQSHGNTRNG